MNVFAPGITWDPREPLPPEFATPEEIDRAAVVFGGPSGDPARKRMRYNDEVYGQTRHTLMTLGATTFKASNLIRKVPDLTVQEDHRNVLAPLSITLDASILDDIAIMTATQMFWNNSESAIPHGVFTFPLPNGCTVTGLSCRIGAGTILKGIVKRKQDAQESFDTNLAAGRTTALLEQNTPEIFTTSLGNIPADTKVKIEVSFITLLKKHLANHTSITSLTIPTCIASRYGTPEGFKVMSSTDIPQGLRVNIEIKKSDRVQFLVSRTHDIVVEKKSNGNKTQSWNDLIDQDADVADTDCTTLVRLNTSSAFLTKDFVLDLETGAGTDNDTEVPMAWLEDHPFIKNHQALMLKLPKKIFFHPDPASKQGEIIFLADRSGSMEDKIRELQSAMKFFLKGIPVGKRFNIWSFGSSYAAWSTHSVVYSEKSLKAALSYVKTDFRADLDGTELLGALDALINSRDQTMPTDILVLTDGEVWRLDQTLQLIRDTRKACGSQVRFFSLGIGNAVSHALVEGIAKVGGGYSEVIAPQTLGGWEDRVVTMAKTAWGTKHIGPLQLTIEGEVDDDRSQYTSVVAAHQSPAKITDLNPFFENRIWLLLEEPLKVGKLKVISRTWDGLEVSTTITVRRVQDQNATIHKLAAKPILDDMRTEQNKFGSYGDISSQKHNHVQQRAEEIAQKWSLASEWTSFLLVEDTSMDKGNDRPLSLLRTKASPGDDLLQERNLESCLGDRRSDSFDSRMNLRYKAFGFGKRKSVASLDPAYSQSSPAPIIAPCIPPPLGHRYSRPQVSVPRDYIILLLHKQKFDGSFDFQTPAEAEKTLGHEVVAALSHFKFDTVPWVFIYTAAVVILLERDYMSYESLWEAMRDKAVAFLKMFGKNGYDMSEVAEALKGHLVRLDTRDSSQSLSAASPGSMSKQVVAQKFNPAPEYR